MSKPQSYTYNWFINQFEEADAKAKKLASSVDEQLFFKKPSPDQWSAAECLAHLVEFGNIYFKRINRGIELAETGAVTAPAQFRPRLFWRGVIRLFEPPYKMKLNTISMFEPSGSNPVDESPLQSFSGLQNRLVDQLKRCQKKGINLNNQKISNPALSFLKMTLSECYGVTDAHQRRHLWQAKQTLKRLR